MIEELVQELRKLLIVPAWREIWKEDRSPKVAYRSKDDAFRAIVVWNDEQRIAKLSVFVVRDLELVLLSEDAFIFETYTEAIKWYMGIIESEYQEYLT